MAIEIRLSSLAPPEAVLAAIREDAREWRESVIPRELWHVGVLQVVARLDPPRFQLRYDRRWQRSEAGDPLRLHGRVVAGPEGGSVVTARVGARGPGYWLAAIFVACALSNLVLGGGTAWWVFVLLAAASAGIDWWNDSGVDRDHAEAAYLLARLEQAVAAASSPSGQLTNR